jgi:hypothetical protein
MTRVANPGPAKATLAGCGAASRTVAVPVDAQAVGRIVDVQQHFSVPDAAG